MKREIIIKKYHLIWEWQIVDGRKVLFGGFSRTKKDANNDAGIVWRQNSKHSDGSKPFAGAHGSPVHGTGFYRDAKPGTTS